MIEFTLLDLECHKTNETGGDEVYLEMVINDGTKVDAFERFPNKEPGIWKCNTGDKIACEQDLFVGEIGAAGLTFHLVFFEEDMMPGGRLFVHSLIKNMIDDLLGEIHITLKSMSSIEIKAGKHAKHVSEEPGHIHTFHLTGGGADYTVRLKFTNLK